MVKMPWHAKPGSPGTAQAVMPERVQDLDDQFIHRLTWMRGRQEYSRATCGLCDETIATCRGKDRFMELKALHLFTCGPCGFMDCADCQQSRSPGCVCPPGANYCFPSCKER